MENSSLIMAVFIALCVSLYKFMGKRKNFHRVTFWGCAALLVVTLCVTSYDSIDEKSAREDSVKNLVAALRETENELKKYKEIYAVEYLRGDEGLIIRLKVSELADEKLLRDKAQDTFKRFTAAGGGVDNIKVAVEIEKSEQ